MWAMAGLCSVGTACAGAHAPARSHTTARPSPAFARTVVLTPVSGRVLIRLPGTSAGFVRLSGARAVPVGTVLDTTAGRVSLTSANPSPGGIRRPASSSWGSSGSSRTARAAGS